MKSRIIIITCLFMCSFFTAFAQKKFYVIPKVGLNLSTFTNIDSEWKTGFNVGCGFEFQLNTKFALEPGLFFSQMGTKGLTENERIAAYKKDIGIDYIYVPVVAKYYFNKNLNVYLGPQVGYQLFYSHKPIVEIVEFDHKIFVVDGVIGVGYKLPCGLSFSASYIAGFTNLEWTAPTALMKYNYSNNRHSAFQFNIGWYL